MSYPRDLDEIPTAELMQEMDRRLKAIKVRKCHYCNRPMGSQPACKLQSVHDGTEEVG